MFPGRGAAAEPRPGVVVQADEVLNAGRPVLVCPLPSELAVSSLILVNIAQSKDNGLRTQSQAMVDRINAALPKEVETRIRLPWVLDIARLELALVNRLGLSGGVVILSGSGASS